MAVAAAVPLTLLAWLLPRPLVLPAVCLLAFAGAGAACTIAWLDRTSRQSQHASAWDVSGALVLIGCAAAILGDPNSIVQIVESTATATETK